MDEIVYVDPLTERAKVARVAGMIVAAWVVLVPLIVLAWHNPATALLFGGTLVVLWSCLVNETDEHQAELDRVEQR